jgi:nucleotide sugar dehydrogenase
MEKKNISVIGIGRLGICVCLCLEKAGYSVVGVDTDPNYVDQINKKTFNSPEPSVSKMLKESNNFVATTKIDYALEFSDVIFIYVATPSGGGDKHYDHTTLGKVLMSINQRKVVNKHIVIGCTVIPGYIREVGNSLLKDCVNTSLSYNPEFISQGDIINGIFFSDFILIGEGSKEAGDRLDEIYKNIADCHKRQTDIHRMSPSSAEITKLSVNCFVTTKIAFANMIGDVADLTPDADKFHILKAIGSDSRIGKKYLNAGYGFGGPCFPRDNRALGGYIKSVGINPLIPEATDLCNKLHTQFQVKELLKINITNYMVNGAGYKEPCTVPIIEESQKLLIGSELAKKGINVTIKDSKLLLDCVKLEYGDLFSYEEVQSLE